MPNFKGYSRVQYIALTMTRARAAATPGLARDSSLAAGAACSPTCQDGFVDKGTVTCNAATGFV